MVRAGSSTVMAGTVPAIHAFAHRAKNVDPGTPGHDEGLVHGIAIGRSVSHECTTECLHALT